jgi:hypothetical protein
MEVVGHQTIGVNAQLISVGSFPQAAEEGLIVLLIMEE